jgi:hypothetical protein
VKTNEDDNSKNEEDNSNRKREPNCVPKGRCCLGPLTSFFIFFEPGGNDDRIQ